MPDQINCMPALVRAKGREARLRGDSRDSHHMNWHAAALVDWLAGYDEPDQATELAEAES